MASFKKLNNGSYQATIFCGREVNGKQIRKYITCQTLKECKDKAREIETDHKEGLTTNTKTVRLSTWMDEWIELNRNRLSPSTIKSYKMIIKTHLKPYFGNIKINQIREIHIKRYMSEKLKTIAVKTLKTHILLLSSILSEVLKNKNPILYMKLPKQIPYKPHIITEEEFNIILKSIKNSKYELPILLSAWCGLRRGEILALKWDNIDFKNNIINIYETVADAEEKGYIIKTTKSSNGVREIIAPKEIMDILQKKRKEQNVIHGIIFKMIPDSLSRAFKREIKKVKLTDIRFHDLRHYHASWLYKNGIPDLYAAQRLGHDIQTLKMIYQHLDINNNKILDSKIISLIENKKIEGI